MARTFRESMRFSRRGKLVEHFAEHQAAQPLQFLGVVVEGFAGQHPELPDLRVVRRRCHAP